MSPDDNTTGQANVTLTGRLGFRGRHATPEELGRPVTAEVVFVPTDVAHSDPE